MTVRLVPEGLGLHDDEGEAVAYQPDQHNQVAHALLDQKAPVLCQVVPARRYSRLWNDGVSMSLINDNNSYITLSPVNIYQLASLYILNIHIHMTINKKKNTK